MNEIEELKKCRDSLHDELNQLVEEKEAMFGERERCLRLSIKEMQDEVYYKEMAPRVPGISDEAKKRAVLEQLKIIRQRLKTKDEFGE